MHFDRMSIMNFSKKALMDFIETSITKGRLNKNTGAGIRAACRKILEQVGPEEDVSGLDVTAAVFQYNNRHPNELSADSLRVYESRVRGAIDSFVQSVKDPTGYKLPGKTNGAKAAKAPTKKTPDKGLSTADASIADAPSAVAPTATARAAATETSLALPFPLRPNFLAQIVVPRDLTRDEAKRLGSFIDALAHDPPISKG
jgi:hypothetical protein